MILTNEFLSKWFRIQYPNILIHGSIEYIIDYLKLDKYKELDNYKRFESIYLFNVSRYKKKKDILIDIESIIKSINHFGIDYKKQIIILNIDLLNNIYQNIIKTYISKFYETSIFMIHSVNIYKVIPTLRSLLINIKIPDILTIDNTVIITYKKIIKLLKKSMTRHSIESINELSYYYYMHHKDSIELQRYIIKEIGKNNYLPNKIKINIVKDITELNHLYKHSYRKPIFLEAMIMCLFKHLENYTSNL